MKAQVLDQGKFAAIPENWTNTEGGSFQLYVDDVYIGSLTGVSDKTHLILVSTSHKVELRGDA